MSVKKKHIKALSIKGYSGYKPKPGAISFPKKHQYYVVRDIAIAGGAKRLYKVLPLWTGSKIKTGDLAIFHCKTGSQTLSGGINNRTSDYKTWRGIRIQYG